MVLAHSFHYQWRVFIIGSTPWSAHWSSKRYVLEFYPQIKRYVLVKYIDFHQNYCFYVTLILLSCYDFDELTISWMSRKLFRNKIDSKIPSHVTRYMKRYLFDFVVDANWSITNVKRHQCLFWLLVSFSIYVGFLSFFN